MTPDTHEECAKKRELDMFIDAMNRWQSAQNGSLGRLEAKVDEIHRAQVEFYPNLMTLMETEVDRRRHDDEILENRIVGLETNCGDMKKRLDTLEVIAKIPNWTWKAAFGFSALVVAILTILSLTHVI